MRFFFRDILLTVSVIGLISARGVGAPVDEATPEIETVRIAGATFTMGTPFVKGDREYHADETPLTVTVETFRIGKFQVTAKQMCMFLNSADARQLDRVTLYNHGNIGDYNLSTIALNDEGDYVPRENADSAPANQVTWKGAVLFCQWLSKRTGKEYRLPSEAEWELAARGAEGRRWPWGDEEPGPQHGYRYQKHTRQKWITVSVGSHPANVTKEGVHDLLGHYIGDWCANIYVAHPTAEQANDARADLDDQSSKRIVRGYSQRQYEHWLRLGGLGLTTHSGRTWTRIGLDPVKAPYRSAHHGFRVAEVVPIPSEE
jgi:formylglycine-generating enzyme required for sulfatase activity